MMTRMHYTHGRDGRDGRTSVRRSSGDASATSAAAWSAAVGIPTRADSSDSTGAGTGSSKSMRSDCGGLIGSDGLMSGFRATGGAGRDGVLALLEGAATTFEGTVLLSMEWSIDSATVADFFSVVGGGGLLGLAGTAFGIASSAVLSGPASTELNRNRSS